MDKMPIRMLNGPFTLGCPETPDCGCGCSHQLGGLGETRTLYYANIDLLRHSKVPGDWFPLNHEMTPISKGSLLGSVLEKKVIEGKNWYHFAVVGGWIMGEDNAFYTKTVNAEPLTQQQKNDIATGIITSVSPQADVLIDTYQAGKKVLNVAKYVVPVLITAIAVVASAYVYNSFKNQKPVTFGISPIKKRRKTK